MTSETGLVIAVQKESVTVQMTRSSACSRCGACKPWGDKEIQIEARNLIGAQKGDYVRLSMEPADFRNALAILYGIPFAAIMIGFFLGAVLAGPQAGFAAGIVMAGVAYKIIRATEPARQKKGHSAAVAEIIE